MPQRDARDASEYQLLMHDTGDQMFRMAWPPTRQTFVDSYITPYADSQIDAYCFCVNCSGTLMFYDSDVGEMYGRDRTHFWVPSALRQHEIVKQLCAAGDDPPRLAIEEARAAGMDCFLRLRMNDLHDRLYIDARLDRPGNTAGEPCYCLTDFKRDHPELLLRDPWASYAKNSREYWESTAYNYALDSVRQMFYGLAEELVTRYEPDGLQLDFLRWPIYFKEHEAWAQRHLLTDLVRRIRNCVQQASQRCGRRIHLIADVPETVESGLRAGIDTPTWLREGLVDMVTVGRGYAPFSTPWAEIGDLAAAAGIPAIACFNNGKISGWGRGEDRQAGLRGLRGAVHRSLAAGVQGVFLFNYFYHTADYDGTLAGEAEGVGFTRGLVDQEALAKETRTYELPRAIDATDQTRYGHAPTAWKGQVPITIGAGGRHVVTIDLQALVDVSAVELWLELHDAHFDDAIEFRWNKQVITPDETAWPGSRLFDRFEFRFDVPRQILLEGENRLQISLGQRESRLSPSIALVAGQVTLMVGEQSA